MKVTCREFAPVTQRRAELRLAVVAFAVCAPGSGPLATEREAATFVQDGKAGFVVTHIEYALSQDAKDTGVCPDGMTKGMSGAGFGGGAYGPGAGAGGQRAAGTPGGAQRPESAPSGAQRTEGGPSAGQPPAGVSEEEATRRFMASMMGPNGQNPCSMPEKFGPDPNFRTVKVPDAKVFGIDMDGRDSRAKGKPAPGTCAHNDLRRNERRARHRQSVLSESSDAATRINPPVSRTAMSSRCTRGPGASS